MGAIRIVLVLALAGVMVACAAQASAPAPVDTTQVTMPPSYRFDPPVIRIRVGATVTWRNDDHFTHSVSVQGGGFPLLNLPPGQSGQLTFNQAGEYAYICTYHPRDMQGTVIVVAG